MAVVKPTQLPALLEQSLAPVYVFAGSEPLLLQECRDAVIRAAQEQGFTERTVYEVGRGFDWDSLEGDAAELSLFAARKIVDLRLPTGRPGREGAAALVEMAGRADPDVLLLVSCEKWEGSQRKAKWASTLARAGTLVEIWPVKPAELPGWIARRMKQTGLQPVPEAVSLLAELVEGNLLAAQQEIDKLLLLHGPGAVTAEDIQRSAANSARFNAFRLVECALQGQLAESLRVAAGLRRTGVAIQLLCAALNNELLIAEAVARALHAGENERAAFGRMRVWAARQGPMRAAVRRLGGSGFNQAFRVLSLIDRQSKGRAAGDAWQTLDRLLWLLCEPGSVRVA